MSDYEETKAKLMAELADKRHNLDTLLLSRKLKDLDANQLKVVLIAYLEGISIDDALLVADIYRTLVDLKRKKETPIVSRIYPKPALNNLIIFPRIGGKE